MVLLLHHAHPRFLHFGDARLCLGHIESYVMHAFAVFRDEIVHERIVAQRLEQFDHRSGEVEFGEAEASLGTFILVYEGRAEHAFVELARLRDAFDRDPDVIEFADRLLAHFLIKSPTWPFIAALHLSLSSALPRSP